MQTTLQDKRYSLMEQANERNFHVQVNGKNYKGRIAGARLDFPVVVADGGAIHYEISWALVERIASSVITVIHA